MMLSIETLSILRNIQHYGLHFIFPGFLAFLFFKNNWKIVWLIQVATMLVDLDHLLSHPIFDPNRCSIGFHPLHSIYAIGVYFLFLLYPKTRIIGIGLLLHMLTDFLDCLWI